MKKVFASVFTLMLLGRIFLTASSDQPNILFLFADDWGRYGGMYEDVDPTGFSSVVKTPNLDQLARSGVVFTNAFFPVPSCTPCRGSLMTGQYFWRNGRAAFLGGGDWGPAPGPWEVIPKFPNILEYMGYHVGYSGKIGVDWWKTEHPLHKAHQHYTGNGNRFMEFSQNVMGKADYEIAKRVIYDEVLENFRDFVADRKEAAQPFFYWFGPYNVHRSWIRGSGKALWGLEPDDLKGKMPADWPDVHEVREDLVDYLGEIMAFDAMVKVLVDELERMGELRNTLIIATGDNGIPGFPRSKRNLYDKGTRAPLVAYWPEKIKARRYVDDFVNIFDLAPTFIEVAGGTPPDSMDARSLMPQLTHRYGGVIDETRDHVIIGRERHVVPYPMRAIRDENYLYIRNYRSENRPDLPDEVPEEVPNISHQIDAGPTRDYYKDHWNSEEVWPLLRLAFDRRPDEELYDIQADPDQINNLAMDPNYQMVKERLRNRLYEVMVATDDARVHPGETKFDKPPYIEADPERRGKW